MSTRVSYYKELDGVRGIAALLVMFFHFSLYVGADNSFLTVFKKAGYFGQTGVSLFFVLSGFLITRILLKNKNEPNYFSNFYARRMLRIFPLYYLFLVIFYFAEPALNGVPSPPFSAQIYHWFYLQNFALTFGWPHEGPKHFWSLAVEEHFYLFFPLLIYFLNERKGLIAVISLIVISFVVRVVLVAYHYETFYFTFSRMDDLALGALLAFMELKGKIKPSQHKKFAWLALIGLVPTIVTWVVFSSSANPVVQIFKYSLIAFIYFCAIGFVITINPSNPLRKLLASKPMLYSGKISYGLYVYHIMCFAFLAPYFQPANYILFFIAGFSLAYVISSISFYLYEIHFLKLKRFFEWQPAGKSAELRKTSGHLQK